MSDILIPKSYSYFIDKFYEIEKPFERKLIDTRVDYKSSHSQLILEESSLLTGKHGRHPHRSAKIEIYSYLNYSDIKDNGLRYENMLKFLEDEDIKEIIKLYPNNLMGVVYELYDDTGKMVATGEHTNQTTSSLAIITDVANNTNELEYEEMLVYSADVQIDMPRLDSYNISRNSPNKEFMLRISKLKLYNTSRDGNIITDTYITDPNMVGNFNNAKLNSFNSASQGYRLNNSNFISSSDAEKTIIDRMCIPVELEAPPIEEDILIVETSDEYSYTVKLPHDVRNIKISLTLMTDTLLSTSDSSEVDKILKINNLESVVDSVTLLPTLININPGDVYQMGAVVNGYNMLDDGVIYSVENNLSIDTIIDETGLLTISAIETSPSIVIKATSIEDPTVYGSQTVSIGAEYAPSIDVEAQSTTIEKGSEEQLVFTVSNIPMDTKITTIMVGNTSPYTVLDETGLLFIGEDETATEIELISYVDLADGGTITDTEIVEPISLIYSLDNNINTSDKTIVNITKISIVNPPEPTGIIIEPDRVTLSPGDSFEFIINIESTGEILPDIEVSVSGNTDINTIVTNSGLLTVGADETSTELTVTAKITDTELMDSAYVTLTTEPYIQIVPDITSILVGETKDFEILSGHIPEGETVTYILENATSETTMYTALTNKTVRVYVGLDETSDVISLKASYVNLGIEDVAAISVDREPKIYISPNEATAYAGSTTYFEITTQNMPEGAVLEASVEGNLAIGTVATFTDASTVELVIDSIETSRELTLVISIKDSMYKNTAIITISSAAPVITISPKQMVIAEGADDDFIIDIKNPNPLLTTSYTLTGAMSKDTKVIGNSAIARVYVAEDETADSIILTASIPGASTSDTAEIIVGIEKFPALTAPTVTSSISNTLIEVGTVNDIVFTINANRGAINPAYGTDGFRAGLPETYTFETSGSTEFEGEIIETVASSDMSETQTVENFRFTEPATIVFVSKIKYASGEQPLSSHGNDYQTAYQSSTITGSNKTLNVVLPYFATVDSLTSLTKYIKTIGAYIEVAMPTEDGINKQSIEIPSTYTLEKIEQLNTLSGKWEEIDKNGFSQTSIDKDINGLTFGYLKITNSGGTIGDRSLRFYV